MILAGIITQIKVFGKEDGGEIGGSELTSPCTWVKHLPTLLRNKQIAKSSPEFRKTGDQKVQKTLRKQKVRGLLQDKKVPGTNTGTRATAAPGLPVRVLPQDSWERAQLMAPSAAKQGLSNTVTDPVT